jgi:nitroreductase
MDVYEALYTTRMMRRMRPDPISIESRCRILDAAIRAPSGFNGQRWHFLTVDDPATRASIAELYRSSRAREWAEIGDGRLGQTVDRDGPGRAATVQRLRRSGDFFTEHLVDVPLLLFVFAVDDWGGANSFPAVWSALLAARAEGIGGVLTTTLHHEHDAVCDLLEVPREAGWRMVCMVALGYPRGRWGVATNRRPVHEVSSHGRWGAPFPARVPEPLWPPTTTQEVS